MRARIAKSRGPEPAAADGRDRERRSDRHDEQGQGVKETVADGCLPVSGLAVGLEMGLESVGPEGPGRDADAAEEGAGEEPEARHERSP